MSLTKSAATAFEQYFKSPPQLIIKAPGRVNLIGEHTDYNDGFVLPCAINYATWAAISPRDDNLVNVVALDFDQQVDQFELNNIQQSTRYCWANYIRGVFALSANRFSLKGCNILVTGNVPKGAGLSSSASLEVAIAYAISQLNHIDLSLPQHALIAQQAENEFAGCACGIMDQLVSACGVKGHALGIDCRSLQTFHVAIPQQLKLMIINSNVKRGLVDSEYNTRRQQCEQAAKHFGVSHLRDVPATLFALKKHLLPKTVAQRAQHVVDENQRTLEAMDAFERGDIPRISQLMAASHQSMKTLFEITTPEIDFLVELISRVIGQQGGVRMTGGGFGGCVVALVPEHLMNEVTQQIEQQYFAQTGLQASWYFCEPEAGVHVVNEVRS